MSTAIDFAAMMKRVKASKVDAAKNQSTTHSVPSGDPLPSASSARHLISPNSLENHFGFSPEGLKRVFYIPEFITSDEEAFYLSKVRCFTKIQFQRLEIEIG